MKESYFFYKLCDRLSRIVPLKAAYRIGGAVSMVLYRLSPREREAVWRNLEAILGGASGAVLERGVRDVYLNFSRYCVDVLYLGRTQEAPNNAVRFENLAALDRARARKKGVVMLSAHIGNWELAAMALASKVPLSVIVNPHSDKRIDRFFVDRRLSHGLKIIPVGIAFRRSLAALRKNEAVGINGDRRFSSEGMKVKFFGRDTILPRGPAFLSLKSGAPVVGGYLVPSADTRYLVRLYDPIFPDEHSEPVFKQKVAGLLEDMIRRYPTQWFSFEDLWDSRYYESTR